MSDEFDDASDPTRPPRDTRPSEAARGRCSPTDSRLISRLYVAANRPLQTKLLVFLLRPLSPLGLVAIAAGAFGGFLHRSNAGGLKVAIDDVSRFSSEQIGELARFVEQVSPHAAGFRRANPGQLRRHCRVQRRRPAAARIASFSRSGALPALRNAPGGADARRSRCRTRAVLYQIVAQAKQLNPDMLGIGNLFARMAVRPSPSWSLTERIAR